jgi:hypothetical protein
MELFLDYFSIAVEGDFPLLAQQARDRKNNIIFTRVTFLIEVYSNT